MMIDTDIDTDIDTITSIDDLGLTVTTDHPNQGARWQARPRGDDLGHRGLATARSRR